MRIATYTMTSNREDLIGDALRSVVDWVDFALIVDLGITDRTLNIAQEVLGDKFRVVKYPGPTGPGEADAAAIRNFALDELARLGADWGCTLDTDERIDNRCLDIHAELAQCPACTVVCPMDGTTYSKERFIKLPAVDRFVGMVHECVVPGVGGQATLHAVSCRELPKSAEQTMAKMEFILPALERMTQENPQSPRWFYYLGDTLANLGRKEDAIRAFDNCACMWGWDEEGAWACFRMALLMEEMGNRVQAMQVLGSGMVRHPGIAELPWLAGELALRQGKFDHAVYWGRLAAANGTLHGEGHFLRPRIGFRHPWGASKGGYDLMARAYDAMGMVEEAARSRALIGEGKAS